MENVCVEYGTNGSETWKIQDHRESFEICSYGKLLTVEWIDRMGYAMLLERIEYKQSSR